MSGTLVDIVQFSSSAFEPFLPEEAQVNPGVYGAELALWLCARLAARGVYTSYPEYEDWGWYLEYSLASGCEFSVHCGNIAGSRGGWAIRLQRFPRKLFGRDKPPFSEASVLVDAIRDVLSNEPDITDLKWLYEHGSS